MKPFIVLVSLFLVSACQERQASTEPAARPAAPVAAQSTGGVQIVDLKISGADYQPAAITVKQGIPVRLNVTRDEKPTCGDVLVIPSQNIKQTIPVNQVTPVEFTPKDSGDLEITCGMNMMRGKVVVQASGV